MDGFPNCLPGVLNEGQTAERPDNPQTYGHAPLFDDGFDNPIALVQWGQGKQ
jgi:hypothetical protein